MTNRDNETIASFGDEWSRYNQHRLNDAEHKSLFEQYFRIFPWSDLPEGAEGFDMGCGSGRWAVLVAPKVGSLHCIDPSGKALEVAKIRMAHLDNVDFINAGVDDDPLEENSQDFGFSLGVLHHVPDTASALLSCVKMLKPGAPFLVYLYYRFDNKPFWFIFLWRMSDAIRRIVSKLPPLAKLIVTEFIAILVYFPLAKLALGGQKIGLDVSHWPLSAYRFSSLYTMRTDSRDRFGTPLERRFTRAEIKEMMQAAGLRNITFSEDIPFWCAVGYKKLD